MICKLQHKFAYFDSFSLTKAKPAICCQSDTTAPFSRNYVPNFKQKIHSKYVLGKVMQSKLLFLLT